MNDYTAVAVEVLRELATSPNGQIRLVGTVMCIGPGYYILNEGQMVSNFVYVMLGIGSLFIVLSAVLAVYAAKFQADNQRDERIEDRASFPPSERIEKFAKEVLTVPRSKGDLAGLEFVMYKKMSRPDLHALLMQTTAKECVLSGVVKMIDGKYVARDATERTVIVVGEE